MKNLKAEFDLESDQIIIETQFTSNPLEIQDSEIFKHAYPRTELCGLFSKTTLDNKPDLKYHLKIATTYDAIVEAKKTYSGKIVSNTDQDNDLLMAKILLEMDSSKRQIVYCAAKGEFFCYVPEEEKSIDKDPQIRPIHGTMIEEWYPNGQKKRLDLQNRGGGKHKEFKTFEPFSKEWFEDGSIKLETITRDKRGIPEASFENEQNHYWLNGNLKKKLISKGFIPEYRSCREDNYISAEYEWYENGHPKSENHNQRASYYGKITARGVSKTWDEEGVLSFEIHDPLNPLQGSGEDALNEALQKIKESNQPGSELHM